MSLSSHLKDKNSPVREFLRTEFPNSRAFLRDARKRVREANTVRPNMTVPWSTIGIALDYRIRYYFDITPHDKLVAYDGALHLSYQSTVRDSSAGEITANPLAPTLKSGLRVFFSRLDALVESISPVGRWLEDTEENELNRHCIVLALLEEVVRIGRLNPNSPLAGEEFDSYEGLISIAEPHWIDDLKELSRMFYDNYSQLLEMPCVLNPTFEGSANVGGADADLIVDDTLIDIKTYTRPVIEFDCIWQLLGYVLLDYGNHREIDGIGLYMARQGILIKWSLAEVIQELCVGEPPSLTELRMQFKELCTGFPISS